VCFFTRAELGRTSLTQLLAVGPLEFTTLFHFLHITHINFLNQETLDVIAFCNTTLDSALNSAILTSIADTPITLVNLPINVSDALVNNYSNQFAISKYPTPDNLINEQELSSTIKESTNTITEPIITTVNPELTDIDLTNSTKEQREALEKLHAAKNNIDYSE
jgi:hypothetical protein